MTDDKDYIDYGDFSVLPEGSGPTHEVSPRKSKEPVTQKSGTALPSN